MEGNDSIDTRHFVQFYDNEDFLLDSVSGFIGAGLKSGEGAVVIARKDYRDRLETRLTKLGVDLPSARASDQYLAVDAAETLRAFTDGNWPSEELFNRVIRRLLMRAARDGRRVRAFGEMVTLLWEAGNLPAAIRLEQYWDDLTQAGLVSLFCAYPVTNAHGKVVDAALAEICRQHSSVINRNGSISSNGHGSNGHGNGNGNGHAGSESEEDRARAPVLLRQEAPTLGAEISRR